MFKKQITWLILFLVVQLLRLNKILKNNRNSSDVRNVVNGRMYSNNMFYTGKKKYKHTIKFGELEHPVGGVNEL